MFTLNDLNLLETKGYENVRSLLEEWTTVKKNMLVHGEHVKIFLPNYFFVADPGVGMSFLIHAMSEHLYQLGIMPFSNTIKYIEFILEYDDNVQTFKSFERLYNLLEHGLSQHGQPYAGVLMINITDWVEKKAYIDKRFIRFLDYLTHRDDIQMIILVSESTRSTDINEVESIISGKLRIKTIRVKTSPAEVLLEKLITLIQSLQVDVDEDAKNMLLETIKVAMKSRSFHGVYTIKNLAKDLVYEKYRQKDQSHQALRVSDLIEFSPQGEWIKQFDMNL